MNTSEILEAALQAEFTGEVLFHDSIPANVTAPAVIVAPGDPFLENGTMGMVTERWEVIVAVGMRGHDRGISDLRDLSLRVRDVVSRAGGHWLRASGPRDAENLASTASFNSIEFRYHPSIETGS